MRFKKFITKITLSILMPIFIINLKPIGKVYAEESHAQIVDSLYEQLVIEGKNTATFTGKDYDEDWKSYVYEIIRELCMIDNEDTPYDGTALLGRGDSKISAKGNQYTISFNSAYDINEAQKVIDEIISTELSDKITDTTSNKEIMYIVCDYITNNFSYDYETYKKRINSTEYVNSQNFIDAYYGNHKLICTGFSNLAYLLATELGVKCQLVTTDDHMFTLAQTGDNGEYIAYDLTLGRYAGVDVIVYKTDSAYNMTELMEVILSSIYDYKLASILAPYPQLWYYIIHGQATSLDYYTPLNAPACIACIITLIFLLSRFIPRRRKVRKKKR